MSAAPLVLQMGQHVRPYEAATRPHETLSAAMSRHGSQAAFLPVLTGAAIITAGLFITMQTLISEDFRPQDKSARVVYDINPTIIDPPLRLDRRRPDPLKQVEIPPAPPMIGVPETGRPQETLVPVTHTPVHVPQLTFDFPTTLSPIDRDPEPIVRTPPAMPGRADRSGHCLITFDISGDGKPYNVAAQSCSQTLFRRAAVQAVSRWTYRPELVQGRPVARTGFRTRIVFNLTDEQGRLIPE